MTDTYVTQEVLQPEGQTYFQTHAGKAPIADPLDQYAAAIARIESGGNYATMGPKTSSGDQAYGKYQVMGANVPAWTKAALGRSLTPQEFLNDPKAQDAVFKHRFGKYVSDYGNPQDAASAWFTGKPLAQGANKADVLGTTGSHYVDMFNSALNGGNVGGGGATPSNVLAMTPNAKMQAALPALMGFSAAMRIPQAVPLPATNYAQTPAAPMPPPVPIVLASTEVGGPAGHPQLPEFKLGVPLSVQTPKGLHTLHPVDYDPFEGSSVG